MLHLMHYLKTYKHALFILKHLIRTDIRTKKIESKYKNFKSNINRIEINCEK